MTVNSLTAIVFPGQGSQSVGMLNELVQAYPLMQQTFEQASQVLNYDLWAIVSAGPTEQLDQTAITQPALLTASYAMWQMVQTSSLLKPAYFAGHSLGEYTALVCAEALGFEDAVKLVAARGEYMQAAVQPGAGLMSAIIGLENEVILKLCHEVEADTNEVVAPANYNSLGQVVIAGHKSAVLRVNELAKAAGAKLVMALPVSVPSHCALMQKAADRLSTLLTQISFRQPKIPVINNVDVRVYQSPDEMRDGLVRQLYCPVRWVETVQYLAKAGVGTIVECGPGKVLTGLMKRIDKSLQLLALSDLEIFNRYASLEVERNTHE